VKRAGIGVAIAYLVVAVVSIVWPARSATDYNRVASPRAPGTQTLSAYTPFMGAVGLMPHDSDRLRMAWIDRYGSAGRWVLFTGTASILSPPDSLVTLVADVGPGTRVLAWGDWGFLLAAPRPDGDGVVIRVLGPAGSPLAESELDR
jgi:hypothetical protein